MAAIVGSSGMAFRSPPMTTTASGSATSSANSTSCRPWQVLTVSATSQGGGQVASSHGRSSLLLARWLLM